MGRVLFAAPSSGSGKTTVTCAVVKALSIKGLKVSAFKCGPDYIDPMFHKTVLGAKTGNLDTFFCDEDTVRYILDTESNLDISIIEGVMGYYDGLGGIDEKASTYDVARATNTPVVLIVDCQGMSLSIVSIIKGILEYRKDSNIKGVILNKISMELYLRLRNKIEEELNISVLGYLPKISDFTLKSRHLGLVMPNEIKNLQQKMYELAIKAMETIDVEGIIKLSKSAPVLEYKKPIIPKLKERIKIGVALDSAFCFYYSENLRLLEEMGAELVRFSPLKDKILPKGINGLIIGGGYPELYAKELSENLSMRESLCSALEGGIPCIAECGGFLYLQDMLESESGSPFHMVGFLSGQGVKTNHLSRFGYITLTTGEKTVFGEEGTSFFAHEFHYWDSTVEGELCDAVKPIIDKKWKACVSKKNTFAGFPHIHFYSNMKAVFKFLECCEGKNDR